MSGQQKRKERTRERLLSAAEKLFAERGADAVAVDEIVAAAEVAKGTFYNYFADKDELSRALTGRVHYAIEDEITRANDGVADAAERMARAIAIYQLFARRNPTRARLLQRMHAGFTRADAAHNKGPKADIVAGIAQGRFDKAAAEDGIVVVLGSVLAGIGRAIDERRTPFGEAAERAGNLAALVLRALGMQTARAEAIAGRAADEIFKREKERERA